MKLYCKGCSTNENKSKHSVINKPLLQNVSADENELRSTEGDVSECANKEQKDAKDDVPYDVTKYFNLFHVFECRRNILDRLDVSYERACLEIQSTISDSAYFDSEEQIDAKSKFRETG